MRIHLSALALAAGVLATAGTASAQDIPVDTPVSSLLSSAQTHLSRGETAEALNYYDAAIARDPNNYLTLFKRATTYLSVGRVPQAQEDFNKVLSLKPGFEGAHVQLAKIKVKVADWDGARSEYISANLSADSPEIAEVDAAKTAAAAIEPAIEQGQWEDCVNHAGTAIYLATRSTRLRELRARCRFERGELEEAISDMQHVLAHSPGDITPHVTIAATMIYALGDVDNGIVQIRKCLHSDPESKPCKKLHRQAKALQKTLNKIQGQLDKGQPTTAGKGLAGNADEPGVLADVKAQGEELRNSGNIPSRASLKLYARVVEMACQAFAEAASKDAGQYCADALALNPDSFWALFHKGKTLMKEESYEAAINTFQKAGEAHPHMKHKTDPILRKAQVALRQSKMKDYYKVLNVARDADERQIKAAYRKASKQYHPDKRATEGVSKEAAEKKMSEVNEAYEVLSDPELRARFDRGDDPNPHENHGSPFQQGGGFGGGHPFFQSGGGFPGGGRGGGMKFNFNF